MIDYLCTKSGDFTFSRFGFIVRIDRQTESHTARINAILTRLPPASDVIVLVLVLGLEGQVLVNITATDVSYQTKTTLDQYYWCNVTSLWRVNSSSTAANDQ